MRQCRVACRLNEGLPGGAVEGGEWMEWGAGETSKWTGVKPMAPSLQLRLLDLKDSRAVVTSESVLLCVVLCACDVVDG